jgi:zinc/manganese transport system permease protein
VYLVFATLIIPALATRHASRLRLLKSYVVGALGYTIGLFVSAWFDLPSGAVVVWALALVGVAMFAIESRGTHTRTDPHKRLSSEPARILR